MMKRLQVFAVGLVLSVVSFRSECFALDGVVPLNVKKIHLFILEPYSFPLRFYDSKTTAGKLELELNSKGLYRKGREICTWPNQKYDEKQAANMVLGYSNLEFMKAGKYSYRPCPIDQPVKSTWGDGGAGAAALYIEIESIQDEWAQARVQGSTVYLSLKPFNGKYRIEPAHTLSNEAGD